MKNENTRTEATINIINRLSNVFRGIEYDKTEIEDFIPIYLASIESVLEQIALSIAVLADMEIEERKEKKEGDRNDG